MLAKCLRAVAVAVAATVVALGPATNASANPTAEEIERQIDQAWQQLEPVIEQYNAVHSELKLNREKAEALQRQLQPLQLQVDVAMARVGVIAAQAYKGGRASALNAILLSGSPTGLADQLFRLDMMARNQRAQISDVAAVRDKYAADKKALDDLIARQVEQDADLAAKKKDIEARIANLQRLRQQAYGAATARGGRASLRPVACPVEYSPGAAGVAAKTACAQIGKPYVWGAEGPNAFDCSGLTLYAWKAAGVSLRHYTRWQYSDTRRISRSELRPGDLVFFYGDLHHVGLYVGGGWMVHAPHVGDHVRMQDINRYGTSPVGYGRVG